MSKSKMEVQGLEFHDDRVSMPMSECMKLLRALDFVKEYLDSPPSPTSHAELSQRSVEAASVLEAFKGEGGASEVLRDMYEAHKAMRLCDKLGEGLGEDYDVDFRCTRMFGTWRVAPVGHPYRGPDKRLSGAIIKALTDG
jgi:hypothetical protein